MDDFELELKRSFLDEASQLISEAEQCFLDLERNPGDLPTLEKIFRIAHNIKGSSKAVGFDSLGAFTHVFESFLLRCKSGDIAITPTSVSLMLLCLDWIRATVENLRSGGEAANGSEALVEKMTSFSESSAPVEAAPAETIDEASPAEEPAPPFVDADDPRFGGFAESAPESTPVEITPPTLVELAPPAFAPPPSQPPSSPVKSAAASVAGDESIRVSVARLEKLLNFVGELVILQTVLQEQALTANPRTVYRTVQQLGKATKEVQELAMSLRMVPLKQTFQKMQRIVRDSSSALGKRVELLVQGEETEVDKTVLEALSDPLVHMIRNAVDHGIESAEDRVANGKASHGTILLRAFHQAAQLVIEIQDDGGGIDHRRLIAKAREKGILSANQEPPVDQALKLIFHPGFSTKAQATELSGRGVGMDVVKTNVEALKGDVALETKLGLGTTFRISLPLTLAIVDAMIVRSGDERFVIALTQVHESVKTADVRVTRVTGMGEVMILRGENLPVVRLGTALGRKPTAEPERIALVIRSQGKPFAVLVDDIIGQHQVVVKKLGHEARSMKNFSGSAILGDGRPALIVEMGSLAGRANDRGNLAAA